MAGDLGQCNVGSEVIGGVGGFDAAVVARVGLVAVLGVVSQF